jgi:cob(I)alamin adenosyltransferase
MESGFTYFAETTKWFRQNMIRSKTRRTGGTPEYPTAKGRKSARKRESAVVQLTRIYTRGGDKGKTSLSSGKRVHKHDPRVAAYGTVDETNATVGLIRLHTGGEVDELLSRIQNDLFDLGADLATPEVENPEYPPLRITAAQVERLEQEIDRINANLAPLTSFILPGGSPAAAHLHLARTVSRRAEREITTLAEREDINPEAIRYINRLSDLFFVLCRHLNDDGAKDILWVPGANR